MTRKKDILTGAIFVVIGAAYVIHTLYTLRLGSAGRPGPGFFPLILGALLIGIGAMTALMTIINEDIGVNSPLSSPEPIPWLGIALTTGAIVIFGLTLVGLGMIPAVFITGMTASLASRKISLLKALGLSIGLTVFCVLVFNVGLQMNVRLLGPWILR